MKTKFLILRFSSIGDIILTTPVVRCLKLQYPEAEVHFATKKQFKVLVENNPYIDKYFLLDGPLNTFVEALKEENYNYVIDLHNNLRTSVIKYRLGKPSFSYNKLNYEKWLLVNLKINRMPDVHIVDRNLKTVEFLGVINDNKGLDYFIPPQHEVDLTDAIGDTPTFVAYAIGGQHFTKKLPIGRMIDLCSKINKKIVLLGGKEDEPNGDVIANALGDKIFNACGKYNLNQSASILKKAEYVISHDTGLMHIASALKKRIVSVWGNTVPEFGMYPYQTQFSIIENKGLPCRPCSKIGYSKCPKGHFKCMNDLVLDKIDS